MRSYFIFSLISIVIVLILDRVLKTHLWRNKLFWKFQGLVAVLTTLVDTYFSGRPIIIFNDAAIVGLRLFHVPLENYFFGFSLITLNLILFEYGIRKKEKHI